MRISGFTFVRNAVKLDYPLREALCSALPLVDELVVALAPGDADDSTRDLVASLDDPRIRIVDAEWDDKLGPRAYSALTNRALERCSGDWCLYLQADEVLHEADVEPLRARCRELIGDTRVEGLLFDYLHFFGDYRHLQTGHGWYQSEIRLIRGGIGVRSVRDAQSFRRAGERRITVARAHARIYHYGWARHPRVMRDKVREFWSHRPGSRPDAGPVAPDGTFDYGPLGRLPVFRGTHPRVMRDRVEAMDWQPSLREADPPGMRRVKHKDERLRYRLLSACTRLTGIDLNHSNHGRVLEV